MEEEIRHVLPADIERASMEIISGELVRRGIVLPPETEAVVKRVIHTTADFDYADNLQFSDRAVPRAVEAFRNGVSIITDTNMARAGISKAALARQGGEVYCFMADRQVAEAAKRDGTTRAVAAMRKAAGDYPQAVFSIGNAPTALLELCELIRNGLRPALVVGVPVGFVNVEESKRRIFRICREFDIPCIAAMGRKGGSNVAAAICNALLYTALGAIDPAARQEKLR